VENDMNDDSHNGHAQYPQTRPGSVSTENGQVMLDGPDGVAVAMTPEAALETGRRLIAAAEAATTHQPG
jgi:hypothetical protein